MSAFVNYNKRDASLPRGCKDLIDVLHDKKGPPFLNVCTVIDSSQSPHLSPEERERLKERFKQLHEDAKRAVRKHGTSLGRLVDLEGFIALVYQSTPENMLFQLNRFWWEEHTLKASVSVEEGSELHRRTNEFLVTHRLERPVETGIPSGFFVNLPVTVFCDFGPPPADPPALAALATSFFREVCLLNDTSEVAFEFEEQIIPS